MQCWCGMAVKNDKNNVPNFVNIDPQKLDTWYEASAEYCVPSNWGTSGMAICAHSKRRRAPRKLHR